MQLQGNSGMKSMPHVPVVCSGYYRPTTPRPPLQYAPCSNAVPHATRHKASGRHLHVEAPHAGHGHHSLLNHHMMHHSAQCNPQNTSRTRHPSQLGAAVSRRGPAHPDERALQTPQRPIWRVCAGVLWHDRRVHVGGGDFQRRTARGVARWGKRARRSACVVSRRD